LSFAFRRLGLIFETGRKKAGPWRQKSAVWAVSWLTDSVYGNKDRNFWPYSRKIFVAFSVFFLSKRQFRPVSAHFLLPHGPFENFFSIFFDKLRHD